jgi:hypothetical protein
MAKCLRCGRTDQLDHIKFIQGLFCPDCRQRKWKQRTYEFAAFAIQEFEDLDTTTEDEVRHLIGTGMSATELLQAAHDIWRA